MKVSSPAAATQVPYIQRSLKDKRSKFPWKDLKPKQNQGNFTSMFLFEVYIGNLADVLVEVTKDSEEIKAVFKSYQDCLNHGSTEEALALYAPDVSRSFYLLPPQARRC